MLRKTDFLWISLAAFAGVSLFHTSYRVQSLKDEKITLERQIVAEQDGIQVLKAEWSFLNDPARLEQLAATYLSLKPITATQIAGFDVLPPRPATVPASLSAPAGSQAPAAPPASRASDRVPPAMGQRQAPIATLAAAQAPAQLQRQPQAQTQPRRPVHSVRSASAAGPAFAVAHVSTRSVPSIGAGRDDIGSLLTRMGRVQ